MSDHSQQPGATRLETVETAHFAARFGSNGARECGWNAKAAHLFDDWQDGLGGRERLGVADVDCVCSEGMVSVCVLGVLNSVRNEGEGASVKYSCQSGRSRRRFS